MTWFHARNFVALCSVIFITVASAVSAGKMVPHQQDQALLAYQLSGGNLADICGDPREGHDHRCQFCHLLADAGAPALLGAESRLAYDGTGRRLAPLAACSASNLTDIQARAPPVMV